jgi:hypothetical protein
MKMYLVLTYSDTPPSKQEPECICEVFSLDTREGFGKSVSSHFICRAINEFYVTLFDDIVDKMIPDINMLGVCMVVVILGKCDC